MKSAVSELYAFMGACYGGLVIGALYDVFAFLRLPFDNKLVDGIIDMLFYAAAGVAAALTMLAVNGGEIRMYVFLGMLLGVVAYRKTVGEFVSRLRALLWKKLRQTGRFGAKLTRRSVGK